MGPDAKILVFWMLSFNCLISSEIAHRQKAGIQGQAGLGVEMEDEN